MTNWIIGLVIAAVVVLGGGYLLMSGGYSMTDTKVNATSPEFTDPGEQEADAVAGKSTGGSFTGSWTDLVKRGGTYVCEVDHSSAADGTSGSVYVSGSDVRGDFTSTVAGKSVASHMLKKGDTVYVWGGGMEGGLMMQSAMMQGGGGSAPTTGDVVDTNQSYGWNCTHTTPDASKFVKPAGVEFMDLSSMMQGMGSAPGAR
jgi:hypothetical protein